MALPLRRNDGDNPRSPDMVLDVPASSASEMDVPQSTTEAIGEERAQALRAVYETHLRGVYRYLYQRVGHREEAEDLTAQVFLKAVRELDMARGEGEIRAWLLQVARTTLIDHWRQVYALRAISLDTLRESGWEPMTTTSPHEAGQATEANVAAVLAHLPPRARSILEYRFLYGYSLQETATALRMSLMSVKVAQLRALRLAARLAQATE